MKIGIIGLAQSGKTTVFEALTRNTVDSGHKSEPHIGVVRVPDERIDVLAGMYKPQKTIYAQVEYFLPAAQAGVKKDAAQSVWNQARDCDALINTVRNFGGYGFEAPTPAAHFEEMDQELILADMVVVEKRLEKIQREKRVGKPIDNEELTLLEEAMTHLEAGRPLRKFDHIAGSSKLRGFALLSAKPMLVLFNNPDEDESLPDVGDLCEREDCMVLRGKLEQELSRMSPEEAAEFLAEFEMTASGMDRVLARSYRLLGLISFFTVGEDEVRAWTVKQGAPAIEAAGVIHTDLQKGFIRAEVISYDDLIKAGNFNEAKKQGTVRLEGKTYVVQDGDIMTIRFNV